MKKLTGILFVSTLFFPAMLAWAYEVDTHEEMSAAAVDTSVLKNQTDVLVNLGLKPLTDLQTFPSSQGNPRTVVQLFREGANFEDTLSAGRPSNHFYNPLNGAPLTLGILPLGLPSPNWALEDQGEITGILGFGKQEFSYRDARQYFYDALTKSTKMERDKNFGLTFQTLGMVIHHVQDMAQPQHVRNDQHLELKTSQELALCVLGGGISCATYFSIKNPSLYEAYTNRDDVRPGLPFSGYAPVYSGIDTATFNNPRKFWHSVDGKGLADYTNRGFVSAGTIFDSSFPAVLDTTSKQSFDIQTLLPGTSLKGMMTFYNSTVTDKYAGPSVVNRRAATSSIFDADIKKYATSDKKEVLTLNRFNFDAAHALLIPRAVGYSAGLINYFFRGKIDFLPDPQNSDAYVIKNLSPEAMKGSFTLYYDADDALRYPVPGATWDLTIPKGGQVNGLTFTPPVQPTPSIPDEYILVFKGEMGEEKQQSNSVGAVAAKVVKSPEPDIYIINPDYHHIQRFSYNGDFRSSYATGRAVEVGLSIFNEDRYYNWSPKTGSTSGAATKNGVDFAILENPNGIANNGQQVFVTHANNGGATVSIFDMDGNPLQSRPVSPTWLMEGGSVYVAANRTHFATTSNGYLYGYSIQGGQVFSVSGLGIFSQYVAMTIDRIFAISGSEILSYTLNGGALGAILPVPPGIVGCIEGTEKRFYITTQSGGLRKLHIYKRAVKRGADKNIVAESYSFIKSVPLENGFYEPQCSVDKAYMETLYKTP